MWLSIFFENALVRRVNRRIPIRMVRFCRSTCDVLTCAQVGVAGDRLLAGADALAGAVFALRAAAGLSLAVELHQHGVVDVAPNAPSTASR